MRKSSALQGFAPIVSTNSVAIVLGSMPSDMSLHKQQYYGHPRNAFWPIMCTLFNAGTLLPYTACVALLQDNHLAVWDVLKQCQRAGSLDSAIANDTIITNDFEGFFKAYPLIKTVFFNGAAAEKIYRKQCLPKLESRFNYLNYQRLPSTSPAYAAMHFEQKLEHWQVVARAVVK